MKNLFGRTLGFAILAAALASSVQAGSPQPESSRYLIALKQPTSHMMAPQRAQLQADTQKLMQYLQSSNFKGQLDSKLDNINAVIVRLDDVSQLQALKSQAAVEFVDKETFFKAPAPVLGAINNLTPMARGRSDAPQTPWGIKAIKAPEAWSNSRAGQGARVLVLDTGIDKDHPSLASNFEAGQNFLNDQKCKENLPYPFFDAEGHGTHVSGTIAGAQNSSGFTGVAPRASLLMGRVCGQVYNPFEGSCVSACSNFAVADGINWGVSQKVDVISMSLGGPSSTPTERRAVQAALAAGVTIVAASGNDGSSKISYPAALPGVIAVGATDINNQKASFSQYGPELAVVAPGVDVVSSVPRGTGMDPETKVSVGNQSFQIVPSSTFQGSFAPTRPVVGELVPAGLGKPEDFTSAVKGKFALVKRGDIMFAEKATNAMRAGAAGLVVYNNAPGLIRGAITQDGSTLDIPVFMVEQQVGEALLKAIGQGQVAKASLVVVKTDYASFDGTSMATPHVAGVVALIKAANKNLSPAQVKQILQGTALPLQPNSNNELGAGLVNAQKAVEAAARARVQTVNSLR